MWRRDESASTDPGSPPITERDVRERFDAKLWDFWQVVAWILYRTPEHLDEFVLSPRRARWYDRGANAVLRRAIERGAVTGFDENGCEIKPAAVLGRDPKIRFDSRAMQARWTESYSRLANEVVADARQTGSIPNRPAIEVDKGEVAPKNEASGAIAPHNVEGRKSTRGRKKTVAYDLAFEGIRADLADQKITPEQLSEMSEKELSTEYGGPCPSLRSAPARRARAEILKGLNYETKQERRQRALAALRDTQRKAPKGN